MGGRSGVLVTLSLACMMIVPVLAVSGNPIAPPPVSPESRYEIYIHGDNAFTPYNGVTEGTGTQDDPFIIQGLSIDLTDMYRYGGVYIHETSSHFVIRNVTIMLRESSAEHYGIKLNGVHNGIVDDCRIIGPGKGIGVSFSSNVTITSNELAGEYFDYGLDLFASSHLTVAHNSIDGFFYGIWMNDVDDASVINNTIRGASSGILLVDSTDIAVAENLVYSVGDPYYDNKWLENTWPESHKVIEETFGKLLLLGAVVPAFGLMSAGVLLIRKRRDNSGSK